MTAAPLVVARSAGYVIATVGGVGGVRVNVSPDLRAPFAVGDTLVGGWGRHAGGDRVLGRWAHRGRARRTRTCTSFPDGAAQSPSAVHQRRWARATFALGQHADGYVELVVSIRVGTLADCARACRCTGP